MRDKSGRKKFAALRDLAQDLADAEAAQNLLQEIWAWYGPYGPDIPMGGDDPAFRRLILAMKMPDDLHRKLRDHFKFDDSE